MWILQLNEIEKSFGATLILQGITTNIHEKERVGLVGRNGAGKSTLLKIITGELLPDRGQISFAKQKKMGYLAQDSGLKAEQTIWQEMLEPFTPLLMMERELRRMEEEMASPGVYGNETRLSELTEEYVLLSQRFEEGGGFSFPAKIRSLLSGLGFPEETWDQPITSLSGGQKTRLALVKLLLTEPDLLILDEPTNYLDLSTLTWLENYLRTYPGALLIVSHDRYFLDKLVTRIDELEGGKLHSYTGNYTVYLRQREEERRRQKEAYEAQQEEIKRMEEFVQKNIARASTTKRAQSRRKQLEKMVRLEPPSSPPVLTSFQFEVDQIPGFEVLTVEDLTIGYEKPFSRPTSLTKPLRFQIERGERVAIVGPNGVGKTTLF
ncbi:MAG: ABC-F family ATP-binding cassette domain-containing protein, partial [Thermicanus sp.]|nr:ABC-F family ATP-binding cassette domain-containing protein [Thermicanus sp.]